MPTDWYAETVTSSKGKGNSEWGYPSQEKGKGKGEAHDGKERKSKPEKWKVKDSGQESEGEECAQGADSNEAAADATSDDTKKLAPRPHSKPSGLSEHLKALQGTWTECVKSHQRGKTWLVEGKWASQILPGGQLKTGKYYPLTTDNNGYVSWGAGNYILDSDFKCGDSVAAWFDKGKLVFAWSRSVDDEKPLGTSLSSIDGLQGFWVEQNQHGTDMMVWLVDENRAIKRGSRQLAMASPTLTEYERRLDKGHKLSEDHYGKVTWGSGAYVLNSSFKAGDSTVRWGGNSNRPATTWTRLENDKVDRKAEKRIHPSDGKAYTLDELKTFYEGETSHGLSLATVAHWLECRPASHPVQRRSWASEASTKPEQWDSRHAKVGNETTVSLSSKQQWAPKVDKAETSRQVEDRERVDANPSKQWVPKLETVEALTKMKAKSAATHDVPADQQGADEALSCREKKKTRCRFDRDQAGSCRHGDQCINTHGDETSSVAAVKAKWNNKKWAEQEEEVDWETPYVESKGMHLPEPPVRELPASDIAPEGLCNPGVPPRLDYSDPAQKVRCSLHGKMRHIEFCVPSGTAGYQCSATKRCHAGAAEGPTSKAKTQPVNATDAAAPSDMLNSAWIEVLKETPERQSGPLKNTTEGQSAPLAAVDPAPCDPLLAVDSASPCGATVTSVSEDQLKALPPFARYWYRIAAGVDD